MGHLKASQSKAEKKYGLLREDKLFFNRLVLHTKIFTLWVTKTIKTSVFFFLGQGLKNIELIALL